jgi:dihydropteroate synthase/2-amino-4-hydroxy-6-hydroxymethyldihydropteridine diphosphokinase
MPTHHTVYLALGSNLGDRAGYLCAALQAISSYVTVEATSFLYETPPAIVVDQPKFLNAVCRGNTQLSPHDLLAAIEATMKSMGRVRSLRYGPRIIDIDILFYDRLQVDTDDLTIPHIQLPERAFVLEPLCDLAPDFAHPLIGLTMRDLLAALKSAPLPRVMPVADQIWTWGVRTYILGILNVTPDSFSGDGLVQTANGSMDQVIEAALAQADRLVAEGADALDVGGLSTRPGHTLIPLEEELGHVVPVIEALAKHTRTPISVDTFRSEVAQAALRAGAHLINDVWGLRYDRNLARLAADHGVPLVVMHNRMRPEDAAYRARIASLPVGPPGEYRDIVSDVAAELEQSLALAQSMGVPRWLLVSDPGLGFGKTTEQQLELIHRLAEVRAMGYPLLFGPSRKRFIGQVLGDLPPAERVEGTLASCVLAIDRGADLLRVHDVRAATRAARLADAIVRGPWAG